MGRHIVRPLCRVIVGGIPVGGQKLPLNPPLEPYSIFLLLNSSANGSFTTPPVTFPPTPVTFSLQFAAAAIAQGTAPGTIGFISNPAVVTLP